MLLTVNFKVHFAMFWGGFPCFKVLNSNLCQGCINYSFTNAKVKNQAVLKTFESQDTTNTTTEFHSRYAFEQTNRSLENSLFNLFAYLEIVNTLNVNVKKIQKIHISFFNEICSGYDEQITKTLKHRRV